MNQNVLKNPALSLFQKVLLVTDGSVTELLALYVGKPIRAKKIEQSLRSGEVSELLQCSAEARLLHRKIMLVDAEKSHVFAESIFVFDRFSETIRHKLIETDAPIGLLWREERVEMYREIVEMNVGRCSVMSAHFELPDDTDFVSRKYLLYRDSQPFGVITESFPLHSFK